MRGRKFFTMVGLLTIAALVLAACQPATVEVTRVVTQEKEVEVTRIVAGTPVVEVVTATPAPIEEAEVTYPRNETLYTSGKQWGAAHILEPSPARFLRHGGDWLLL